VSGKLTYTVGVKGTAGVHVAWGGRKRDTSSSGQHDEEPGLDKDLLEEYGAKQQIHENIDSLIEEVADKLIMLDIDLDLFNRSQFAPSKVGDKGDLWTKEEITEFLDKCSVLVENSALITIAMTFGYSGDEEDTKYQTKLVVPRLIGIRSAK